MNTLREAQRAVRLATQRRDDIVAAVRAPNLAGYCALSWDEVGQCLGITRQAAQQKYGPKLS